MKLQLTMVAKQFVIFSSIFSASVHFKDLYSASSRSLLRNGTLSRLLFVSVVLTRLKADEYLSTALYLYFLHLNILLFEVRV